MAFCFGVALAWFLITCGSWYEDGIAIGVIAGLIGAVALLLTNKPQPVKQCPGEVVSMVVSTDGTILCTYMLAPAGLVKETRKMK